MTRTLVSLVCGLSIFGSTVPAYSAEFKVSPGDVVGLIAAINAANGLAEDNTIELGPGVYSLTSVDNGFPFESNGLPVITGTITINGDSSAPTTIARAPSATGFRILFIAAGAHLTINHLTISGGVNNTNGVGGAGIKVGAGGTLTVNHGAITNNQARGPASEGGGILNGGLVDISYSSITGNRSNFDGGGLTNYGTAKLTKSVIADNFASGLGGGVFNGGSMAIRETTIARNRGNQGAGILNYDGTLNVTNTTIAGNTGVGGLFGTAPDGGGIFNGGGALQLQNSIVALNTVVDPSLGQGRGPDCFIGGGAASSLGANLIGDRSDCSVELRPGDVTGDPRLGVFIDGGTPGNGRFPLLADSPAVDSGNGAACASTDQLDTPRNGNCDIGGVEFYPVVNDRVGLGVLTTAFDPVPAPNAPGGTFHITTTFTNTGNEAIANPLVEVLELSDGNVLLNADGGAGSAGARLTPTDTDATLLQSGTTIAVELFVGLQTRRPFTFLINVLGGGEP